MPDSLRSISRGARGQDVALLRQRLRAAGSEAGPAESSRGITPSGLSGDRFEPAPPPGPVGDGDVERARTHTASIGGVSTYRVPGKSGVAFKAGMAVDADGSPRAYHPNGRGLDALANAGRPGNWWGLATDRSGRPFVQGPEAPAPGHYVSTTALQDGRFPASDPRRYVDSETVPYIAIPPELRGQGVKLGDLVAVHNARTGKTAFALVADIGPRGKLGEGSMRLAEELGLSSDPRRGGAPGGISYVAFPGSGTGRPLSPEAIRSEGQRLFDAWGGEAQLAAAMR